MSGLSSIRLLELPYDSGHYGVRMGAGPLALIEAGAARGLRDRGHTVQQQRLSPRSAWQTELVTAFELHRVIAAETVAAQAAGQVPMLLSGNCNATLGVLAGLSTSVRRLGLVWFDAHGDFNTPETDPGGFLDGQGVAMITGRCWRAATSTGPGFRPLADEQVLLVGTRSLDAREAEALRDSGIVALRPVQARDGSSVAAAVASLAERADRVHVHIDLDVYDPSIAPANSYAAPDGLLADEVHAVLRRVAGRMPITSATLSAWDPTCDNDGRMRGVALDLLYVLADLARPVPAPG
ncbi:arginase family protein [Actinoplanes sp. NPDC051513]|uniref:arginase family protein n=1 Tax=Actinoplanes sp. NPDC051513 TaxID=3363908 RepID=UPI0037A377B0